MINMPEKVRLFRTVGDTDVHVSKPNETMSWFNECGAEYIRTDLYDNVVKEKNDALAKLKDALRDKHRSNY